VTRLSEVIAYHEEEAEADEEILRKADEEDWRHYGDELTATWTRADLHHSFVATLKATLDLLSEAASEIEAAAKHEHLPSHVTEHHPVSLRLYERDTEIVRRIRETLSSEAQP
jgi:hypothetical protein